ncbi:hypothetical protein [Microbulbifer taiwanensis]|uniref:phage integrase n=1 Tax=Microbulbifer taiwanensis TaxID=986746 RepID=UPI003622AA12
MAIRKVKSGWEADVRPEGVGGPRLRRIFRKKREAEQFEIDQKALGNQGDWKPPVKDKRRLEDLVEDWYNLHGHTLKDGKRGKASWRPFANGWAIQWPVPSPVKIFCVIVIRGWKKNRKSGIS